MNQFVYTLRKMLGNMTTVLRNKSAIDFNDSSFQILEQKLFATVTLLIQFSFLSLKELNGKGFNESELFKDIVAFREILLRFCPFQQSLTSQIELLLKSSGKLISQKENQADDGEVKNRKSSPIVERKGGLKVRRDPEDSQEEGLIGISREEERRRKKISKNRFL